MITTLVPSPAITTQASSTATTQLLVVSQNTSQSQAVTSPSFPTDTTLSSILTTIGQLPVSSHTTSQPQATTSQSVLLDVNTIPFIPSCRTPDSRSHQISSSEAERVLDELQNFDDLYGWDKHDDQQGNDGWDRYDDLEQEELDTSMCPH